MMAAGQDLRGMVQAGLLEQTGFGRWTKYSLITPGDDVEEPVLEPNEAKIIEYLKNHGTITNAECRGILQADVHHTSYFLKKMTEKGLIKREGRHRWTRYRLP